MSGQSAFARGAAVVVLVALGLAAVAAQAGQTASDFYVKYRAAFDKDYDSLPLEFFEPMVRRVLAAPKRSIYVTDDKAAAE